MARIRWTAVLLLSCAALTAAGEGLKPKPGAGGMVTIPGAPLPPIHQDSVRASIPIYETILAGVRLFGDSAALARGYGFLATLYASVGDLKKAEQLFNDAEKILRKQGEIGRDLGWLNNNRGLVYLGQSRWVDGLRSFRAAVEALPMQQEELLEFRAIALQNLGSTQQFLGSVEPSESAYLEALEILRRLRQSDGNVANTTRAGLASLYEDIKDFAAARAILEDLEKRPNLGKTLRFAVVSHLAYVLMRDREFKGAEAQFRKALALTRKGSAERAMAQMNLAALYWESGEFEQGRREGETAVLLAEEVYGPDDRMMAPPVGTLGMLALGRGDLVKAESLLMRAQRLLSQQPGDAQALAGVTQNLAIVVQRRGNRERALELSRQALDLEKKSLQQILAFGSEAQRLAYRSNAYPYDQLANLGDPHLLAEAVLAMKGAVLESLLAERAVARASRSPQALEELDRIQALKLELMEVIGRGEDSEELRRVLKKHETALAKRFPRPAGATADLARVQAALADGQALIETIRYQLYEDGNTRTPWYGAIVIPRSGEPVWVPLARAQEIDDATSTLLKRLNRGNRGVTRPDQAEVASILRSLDDLLWQPLAGKLPGDVRSVLLSPDAALSFIPWAALLDQNDVFLAERCDIAQVGAGRDLLRPASSSSQKTLLALADGAKDLEFSRLEVEQVAQSAKSHGWTTTVLMDEQATEVELFQHPRPRILHFATHGGQLEAAVEKAIESRLGANPMYRGYLLLGGGKRTRDAWQRGSLLPLSEDGILTAEEVGGLDLRDTWLTVLSACRTGAGDAVTGEGVLGLRRGFMLAGTENLMFSLWSVDDAATAQFMTAFYDHLLRTGDLAGAFHETQRTELQRWRHGARSLSDAVHSAGAFVLTK